MILSLNPDELTDAKIRQALEAVDLIKEKRNGIIKEKPYANMIKQNRYLKEGETLASPMVSLEVLFTTLVINAYEVK